MKKLLFVFLSLSCIFLLSSCTVNWFDSTYEVPGYVVFILAFILFLIVYVFIIKPVYICSNCHFEIKPKWYDFSLVIHFMGKRLIKCPHCKKTSFCKIKNFKND